MCVLSYLGHANSVVCNGDCACQFVCGDGDVSGPGWCLLASVVSINSLQLEVGRLGQLGVPVLFDRVRGVRYQFPA